MTDPEDQLEKALSKEMERYINEHHDNPRRDGCPDNSLLERAAREPANLTSEEKVLFVKHVPKCAQCFSIVKRLKQDGPTDRD